VSGLGRLSFAVIAKRRVVHVFLSLAFPADLRRISEVKKHFPKVLSRLYPINTCSLQLSFWLSIYSDAFYVR